MNTMNLLPTDPEWLRKMEKLLKEAAGQDSMALLVVINPISSGGKAFIGVENAGNDPDVTGLYMCSRDDPKRFFDIVGQVIAKQKALEEKETRQ